MNAGVSLEFVLPLIVALLMFGIGLNLCVNDFVRLLSTPRAAVVGLAAQLLVMPLLAFTIAATFPLSPDLQIGLVIIAACPAATTSNLYTYLAEGDTALSVSLTAAGKLIAVVTIPLYVGLAFDIFANLEDSVHLSFLETFKRLSLMVLAPILVGMAVRHRWLGFALAAQNTVKTFGVVFLVLLVAFVVIRERLEVIPMFIAAGPAAVSLCGLAMMLGYALARVMALPPPQRYTIALEAGMQSGGLAIIIAAGILDKPAMAVPAGVYSLVMYLFAFLFVFGVKGYIPMRPQRELNR